MGTPELVLGLSSGVLAFIAVYNLAPIIMKRIRKGKESDDDCHRNGRSKEDHALFIRRKPPDIWNTAIFFPDEDPEAEGSSTQQFLSYFENAKMSIQICVFLASYEPLTNIIIRKYREGLLIQVISDFDTTNGAHNNFTINRLRNVGIPVHTRNFGHLMHNKFAIFDEEAVLTGSLNWTIAGFTINYENIVVSTHPKLVTDYTEEFNRLWSETKKHRRVPNGGRVHN